MFVKGHKQGRGNSNSGRKTKAEELANAVVLKKLQIELARVQVAMADKDLTKEEYKTLIEAVDKFNKNIQLLGGKPTENVNLTGLSYERAKQIIQTRTGSNKGNSPE